MAAEMIFVGMTVAGCVVTLWAYVRAPLGYQDETGFHYGTPPSPAE